MLKRLFLILFVLFIQNSIAQELTGEMRAEVVDKIGKALVDRYVFPDIGEKCALMIRTELESGNYDHYESKVDFAKQLTEDLQSISKDKHMRVRIRRDRSRSGERLSPEMERLNQIMRAREFNYGFFKVEVLDGNIGYVDLRGFSGSPDAKAIADAAFKIIENTDAVIYDMRKNGGGSPEMVQYVCSYFFSKKVHLNSLYWRQGDRTEEYWTIEVPGKKRPDVPLFVLTSKFTFSGAEEFTYNMQTQKRATIVGEVTGGGANPGGGFPLPGNMTVFIPTGKAINPVTGTNWEGTGVEPEVLVPADSAFSDAYRLAIAAGKTYNDKIYEKGKEAVLAMNNGLKSIQAELNEGKKKDAFEIIINILDKSIESGIADEESLNNSGYMYLGNEKHELAILIFKYNAYKYPESFNVFDSLGEAYMENGNNKAAIENYKKSLELNPDNTNGVEMLKKMGVDYKGD